MTKNILIVSCWLLCNLISFAQAPEKLNYQGVARDNSGNILANQGIGLRITIHSSSSNGPTVYQETHAPTTNQFGLFNVQIGAGTNPSGVFSSISWGTNSYFVQSEMDASGGTNYQDMGTQQLISVPYALYAKYAANGPTGATGATGPTGPTGPTGTTVLNTVNQTGAVGAPGTSAHRYSWKTDFNGNPAWRKENKTMYYIDEFK